MFDAILQDISSRFGISIDRAKQLLGMLIALIFNEKRGGAAGFVDLFRSRGLGDAVSSWIGSGPNQPISATQLESALGSDLIGSIASRAGVDHHIAGSALAAMLPDVFHNLTENGQVPTGASIPDRLLGYVDSVGDFMKDLGAGVLGLGAAAVGGVAHAADKVGDTLGDAGRATARVADRAMDNTVDAARDIAKGTGSGIGKLLPWILLAGIVLLGLFALNQCKKAPAPTVPTEAAPVAEAPAPAAATANPTFGFNNADGVVNINGTLASDAEKTSLLDKLKAVFGADNVKGDITVDAATAPAGWLDKLVAILPDFNAKGLKFDFDGNMLKFDTSAMSDADRNALMEKLNGAFDGVTITGLDKGADALAALKDGFSADDLVKALSMMNIQFKTGSADISAASMVLVKNAAEYIKKAPAGTKIEVGGHTDNVGNADANMKLSDARANSVMAKLKEFGVADGVLTAKGYGDTKPVADNATDAGKAQNRRIEYTIAQ